MKRICCFILVLFLCAFSGCRSGPYRDIAYREIHRAEDILLEAQKIEASVYSPETYLEARLALKKAKELVALERYSEAESMAEKSKDAGVNAHEESLEERKRIKMLAERLLLRAEDLWDHYQTSDERIFAIEVLIEIKQLLDKGQEYLDSGQYMKALDSVQQSHQKLALMPEFIEEGKISNLDEEKKRIMGRKTADEIIKAAQQQASDIIKDARKQAAELQIEIRRKAAKARLEEFERFFPTTYKVKKGETLIDIAKRRMIFNDQFMWPLLYKANRDQMRDPKIVFPGQVLTIPRGLTLEEVIEARKQADAPPPYLPPEHAYNPEFYRKYLLIVPEAPEVKEEEKQNGTGTIKESPAAQEKESN